MRDTRDRGKRAMRGAVFGLLLALGLSLAPTAGAETEQVRPSTGYYTKTQDPLTTAAGPTGEALCTEGVPDQACLDPAQVTGGTPGWPRADNYIYVANVNGNTDAMGVISVPLFGLPFGSTVTGLSMTFEVENEPDVGAANINREEPGLQFCLATEPWAGQDAAAYDERPTSDCSVSAEPTFVEEVEKTEETEPVVPGQAENPETDRTIFIYTIDLMPMASAWADGRQNHGLVVRPHRDAPDNYQVPIRTPGVQADAMFVTVEFTPGELPTLPDFSGFDGGGSDVLSSTSFGGGVTEPPVEQPPFAVEEPQPEQAAPVRSAQGVNPSSPWWLLLALPIGFAVLSTLARGTAEPVTVAAAGREGPIGRLMRRHES